MTLAVVMIVLVVALIIGWVILTVEIKHSGLFWTAMVLGTSFLGLVLVGVVLYLLISIKGIRLTQRQSNFIDSVSHELKSPIASLKLYLQTLSRRPVTGEQAANFYRFMLDDVQRLDTLINHMLDAARLDQQPQEAELVDVELSEILRNCAETACVRYRLPETAIRLSTSEAIVRARPIDLEIIFRNLIDNAIKYGGTPPEVEIDSQFVADGVVTRIVDNGPGIPAKLRRKIFGRFVRLGSELERSQTGTGLGLFIVRTLVRRLHGDIVVTDRQGQSGTIFKVRLPARRPAAEAPPKAAVSPQQTLDKMKSSTS
ncbi:MAG: sensor histidine kinase [Planctomycetota bacterium]|nr:MAG: sensor histidine kinase [Planctomycetota bacterium]